MSNKVNFYWLALIMGLVLPKVSGAVTINIAQYANIAVGHGWVYQQSLYPEAWRVEVDSVTTRNAYAVYLLQEYDSSGFRNDQNFISTDFSVALYGRGLAERLRPAHGRITVLGTARVATVGGLHARTSLSTKRHPCGNGLYRQPGYRPGDGHRAGGHLLRHLEGYTNVQ